MQIENEHLIRMFGGVCFTESGESVLARSGNVGRVIVSRENVPYTAAVVNIVIDNEYLQCNLLIHQFAQTHSILGNPGLWE